MDTNNDQLLSAQTVIRSGAEAETVRQEFEKAGFAVGPVYANSFSISADSKTFQNYFKANFESSSDQGIIVKTSEASFDSEIPLNSVPERVRDKIATIVFSKPPDFGPGGNY